MATPRLRDSEDKLYLAGRHASRAKSFYEKTLELIRGVGNKELYKKVTTPSFEALEKDYYQLEDERIRALSFLAELSQSELKNVDHAEFVEKIDQQREKDNLPSRAARVENLSFGFEIEVVTKGMTSLNKLEWEHAVEALQHLGIPLGRDGDREIELPYSLVPNEQLRAVLTLMKLGIIRPKDKLSLHINIGNFEADLSQHFFEILLIQTLMEAGNFFGRERAPSRIKQSILKSVSPVSNSSIIGLPFVLKNNSLLEWRGFPFTGDFSNIVKGTLTLNSLAEAATTSMKAQENIPLTQEQQELAEYWDYFLTEIQEIMSRYGLKKIIPSLSLYGEYIQLNLERKRFFDPGYQEQKEEIERVYTQLMKTSKRKSTHPRFNEDKLALLNYNDIRTKINQMSHDNPEFQSEIRTAIIRLRQKVRSLAQEA